MRLVTVAHGTRHATGNDVARAITAAAGERLGCEAVAAFVELASPLLSDAVAGGPAVVVPLLLSTGHHVRHDLPTMAGDALLGRPLGPDPLLARVQALRLRAAGAIAGQPVVLVAAGSSDPLATRDQQRAAAHLAQEWGAPVSLATLSGRGRRLADVATPDHAVAPYLLSPGSFADRIRRETPDAVVADVIGAHPLVVQLVVRRAGSMLLGRASA